jgi:hypothetical protein
MQKLFYSLRILVLFPIGAAGILSIASAQADQDTLTKRYAVMRDGSQIGTTIVKVRHDGPATVAQVKTDIQVKIAYITVYRYQQTELEHWKDGKLVAMTSVTDDNGTTHKVVARAEDGALIVDADGKKSRLDPSLIPASLWNAGLVKRTMAINPKDGTVTPVSVVDHGREDIVLHGHPTPAHHYSIATSFPQDVWYDDHHQLIRVELHGRDGSTIHYQPG